MQAVFKSKILFWLGKSVNITSKHLQEGLAGETGQETSPNRKYCWNIVSLKGSSSAKVWRTSRHIKEPQSECFWVPTVRYSFWNCSPQFLVRWPCITLIYFGSQWLNPGASQENGMQMSCGRMWRGKGSSSQNTSGINFVIYRLHSQGQCIPMTEHDWLVNANRRVA